MLGKNRVPEAIAHPPDREQKTTDQKKFSRTAHRVAPVGLSRRPVYRSIPTHIPSSDRITSNPPKSARPPATKPNLMSSRTQTGSMTEPSKDRKSTRLNSSHLGISY